MSASYKARISQKLQAALAPILLEIRDDSEKHAHHVGAKPEGETHFSVMVISAVFDGQTRLARHRLIYRILTDELSEHVHALALETVSAEEHKTVKKAT